MNKNKNVRKEVLGIPAPERAFDSVYHHKNCPFTGNLAVKKEMLSGVVIKKDTNKSATIEWNRSRYVPKYERYEVRRSRLRVHNPPCLDAQVGQKVLVARTRPLSKTKNHVILQIIDEEIKMPEHEGKKMTKKAEKNVKETKKAEAEEKKEKEVLESKQSEKESEEE